MDPRSSGQLRPLHPVAIALLLLGASLLLMPAGQAAAQCNDCISQVVSGPYWEHWFGNRPPDDPTPQREGSHSEPFDYKCGTIHPECGGDGGGQHEEEQQEQIQDALAQLDAGEIGLPELRETIARMGLRLLTDERTGETEVLNCSLATTARFTVPSEQAAALRLNAPLPDVRP